MHPPHLLIPLLLATTSPSLAKKSYDKSKDAVLLSKVRSLTLQSEKLTTGRRSSPIPQITCIGGNARGKYEVDTMQCKNSGSEYDVEDIQWTCQASLPPEFKLGSTDVVCEGYDSPDDPFVLKGSCGVEYRLILTTAGEEKYGTGGFWGGNGRSKGKKEWSDGSATESKSETAINYLFTALFWLVFIGIILVILSKIFSSFNNPRNPNARPNTFWGGGGGGGGGGDDNDDPPPPYTPRSQPRYSKPRSSYGSSSRNTQSGPGFWSGAGLGGAAGYAAGNYMGARNERTRQERNFTQAGPSNTGGSWFGGGSGGGGSSFGGGSAGSSSSPSSSRYSSTGFGGTRRR